MGTRLSGLARQALSLHRALLRAARRKSPEARAGIETAIRAEFERHRHLDPRDLQAVEHRIRAGRKKLAQVLTQVYMKYGRGPDDFETMPW